MVLLQNKITYEKINSILCLETYVPSGIIITSLPDKLQLLHRVRFEESPVFLLLLLAIKNNNNKNVCIFPLRSTQALLM